MNNTKTDYFLDRIIAENLTRLNEEERKGRTPSGKLSASILGDPLQWQLLKTLGVPQKEVDDYTLRKFQRGKHVEDWVVSQMPGLLERQKLVEYRGAIGYVDALIDTTTGYDIKIGPMVNEVKSSTNASFNWIIKEKKPRHGHCLQAAFYAMALDQPYFAITYVASDDYRIWMVVQKTAEFRTEVDHIIDLYEEALKKHKVPVFEPVENWQSNPEYNKYPDWSALTVEEIENGLNRLNIQWPS